MVRAVRARCPGSGAAGSGCGDSDARLDRDQRAHIGVGVGEDQRGFGLRPCVIPANNGAAMRTGWAAKIRNSSGARRRPAIAAQCGGADLFVDREGVACGRGRARARYRRPPRAWLEARQEVDQLAPAYRPVARVGDRCVKQRLKAVVEAQSLPLCSNKLSHLSARAWRAQGRLVNRPAVGRMARPMMARCRNAKGAPTFADAPSLARFRRISCASRGRSASSARFRRAAR